MYIETESIELGFCTYKPRPVDSVFIHRNWVHWTQFLFGPPCVLQIALKKLSKHVTIFTLIPSLSKFLSLSLTLILIPSCSVTLIPSRSISHFHSLSLCRRPLLSVSFPLLPSRFVVVALPLHHSIAVAPSRSIASSSPHSAFLPQTLILVGSTSSLSQK